MHQVKDPKFNTLPPYYPHNNPPMKLISTSIKELSGHSLKEAYNGETFFWGMKPKKGDIIVIRFAEPTAITSYAFRSGNVLHPPDKFHDTDVEVYPEKTKNYTVVDHFDEFGLADGTLKKSFGPLLAMRLRVKKDSLNWVILSEIDIRMDKKETTSTSTTPIPPLMVNRQSVRSPRKSKREKILFRYILL